MPSPLKPQDLPLSPSISSPTPFTPKNRDAIKAFLLDKRSEQKEAKQKDQEAKVALKEEKKVFFPPHASR